MSLEVTVTGSEEMATKLGAINIVALATPIVARAGQEMKKSIRADASTFKHTPSLPLTIFWELKQGANTVEAQAGPKRDKAGKMAFLWLGNSKSAPIFPHPDRYAKEQAEQTVKYLVQALQGVLR